MINVKDTLSRMVMAAPLTVAASSSFSPDAGAQRFDMHYDAKTVSIGTQGQGGQQWRLPDRIKASGNQASSASEWYGARNYSSDRFQASADFGATPSIRRLDDSRTAWYVEEGEAAHPPTDSYNTGWRRHSAFYGDEDYVEARYITRSVVDVELSLPSGSAAGYKHPDNAVRLAAASTHEGTWTWTHAS